VAQDTRMGAAFEHLFKKGLAEQNEKKCVENHWVGLKKRSGNIIPSTITFVGKEGRKIRARARTCPVRNLGAQRTYLPSYQGSVSRMKKAKPRSPQKSRST